MTGCGFVISVLSEEVRTPTPHAANVNNKTNGRIFLDGFMFLL
jgi:hypothetical protein